MAIIKGKRKVISSHLHRRGFGSFFQSHGLRLQRPCHQFRHRPHTRSIEERRGRHEDLGSVSAIHDAGKSLKSTDGRSGRVVLESLLHLNLKGRQDLLDLLDQFAVFIFQKQNTRHLGSTVLITTQHAHVRAYPLLHRSDPSVDHQWRW